MFGRHFVFMSLVVLAAVLLAACSSDPTPPKDLLLDPDDFPGSNVTETVQDTSSTNADEPAVQVELSAPDFEILESLVLFETEDLAMAVLAGIKQDQLAQGVTSVVVEGFQDNSGVMDEQLDAKEASTVFFVEGRALVRITLSGDSRAENIWEIARLAREKSRG